MTDKIISMAEFNQANAEQEPEMTIEEQLIAKLADCENMDHALIIGMTPEGEFVMVSSNNLLNKDANWLIDVAKQYIVR